MTLRERLRALPFLGPAAGGRIVPCQSAAERITYFARLTRDGQACHAREIFYKKGRGPAVSVPFPSGTYLLWVTAIPQGRVLFF